jgi:hypothetical protein
MKSDAVEFLQSDPPTTGSSVTRRGHCKIIAGFWAICGELRRTVTHPDLAIGREGALRSHEPRQIAATAAVPQYTEQ